MTLKQLRLEKMHRFASYPQLPNLETVSILMSTSFKHATSVTMLFLLMDYRSLKTINGKRTLLKDSNFVLSTFFLSNVFKISQNSSPMARVILILFLLDTTPQRLTQQLCFVAANLSRIVHHFQSNKKWILECFADRHGTSKAPESWGPFLEAPGNYRARQAVLFSIPDGNSKILNIIQ